MKKLLLLVFIYSSIFNCVGAVDNSAVDYCDEDLYVKLKTRLQLGDRNVVNTLMHIERNCEFKVQFSPELLNILAEEANLYSQFKMGSFSTSWNNTKELNSKNTDDIYLQWLVLAAYRGEIEAQFSLGFNYLDFSEISEISYSVCWLASALIQGQKDSVERLKELGVSNKIPDLVQLLEILQIEMTMDLNLVTGEHTADRTIEEIRTDRDKATLEKILWEAKMKREGRSDLIFAARDLVEKMKSVKKNPKLKMDYIGKCELDSRFPKFLLDLLRKIETK